MAITVKSLEYITKLFPTASFLSPAGKLRFTWLGSLFSDSKPETADAGHFLVAALATSTYMFGIYIYTYIYIL
jgi:hypothetical protein